MSNDKWKRKRIVYQCATFVEYFEKEETIFVKCYHPSRWSRKNSFQYMNSILKEMLKL